MASKKRLKKDLKGFIDEIVHECIIYAHFHPNVDKNEISSILTRILGKEREAITKISQSRGKNQKATLKPVFAEVKQNVFDEMDQLPKINEGS